MARRGKWWKREVSQSFSGWLSDIITAGPCPSQSSHWYPSYPPFYPASSASFFFSLSRFLLYPSTRTLLSYFVSRHCPFQSPRDCGANTARYRINFLSRGCRDFTLLERRHWGGRSQKTPRRLGSRGGWVLQAWCRDLGWGWNQAAKKIKTRNRRILKGSRGQDAHATTIVATPRNAPAYFSPISFPQHLNASLSFLAFRLSLLGRIDTVRKRHDCSSSCIRTLVSRPLSSSFVPWFSRAYIPSVFIVRARSIFIMRAALRHHRIFIKKVDLKKISFFFNKLFTSAREKAEFIIFVIYFMIYISHITIYLTYLRIEREKERKRIVFYHDLVKMCHAGKTVVLFYIPFQVVMWTLNPTCRSIFFYFPYLFANIFRFHTFYIPPGCVRFGITSIVQSYAKSF